MEIPERRARRGAAENDDQQVRQGGAGQKYPESRGEESQENRDIIGDGDEGEKDQQVSRGGQARVQDEIQEDDTEAEGILEEDSEETQHRKGKIERICLQIRAKLAR